MDAIDGLWALSGVDAVAAVVLVVAAIRGTVIGAIREAFSLTAVAVALIVVRIGTVPASAWLASNAPLELAPWAATLLAGIALVTGSLIAVGLIGRAVRAGARVAGLSLLDRLAGGVLGAAEGALVIAVATATAAAALGPDHSILRETRTLAAYDAAMDWVGSERLADVAAPPLELRR